jgi:hypothetical protein
MPARDDGATDSGGRRPQTFTEPDLPSESGFDPNADMSRSVSTRLQFLAQSESAGAFVGPGDLAWC